MNKQGKHGLLQLMHQLAANGSWTLVNSRSSSVSLKFATSASQLSQTQQSSSSARCMVRSAHGKCHQVLQLSQQVLSSFLESLISSSSKLKITLLHFGHWKMSLYPKSHRKTNDFQNKVMLFTTLRQIVKSSSILS